MSPLSGPQWCLVVLATAAGVPNKPPYIVDLPSLSGDSYTDGSCLITHAVL